MLFSIVIPTYNNLHELQACLAAIGKLAERSFDVLVGVDGSTDGTLEWLAAERFGFPLHILQHEGGGNEGRAATRNLALPRIQGRYTLFLDSDMEPDPGMLGVHLNVLEKGGTISIGTVHYRNAGDNVWVRYTSQRGVAKFKGGSEVPYQYFITPNTALPTAFFLGVGGFDDKISRYGGEDMELGYRIHQAHKPRFVFNADAVAHTTQPKTLDEALPQLREYGATGLRYIAAKWPELSKVYWVDRCDSKRLQDRLLAFFTREGFQGMAKALLPYSPFFIKKTLISYLIVAHVHAGYRTGRY